MSWLSSLFSNKAKSAPTYTPIPYSGRTPESPSYTKESEKAYYDTILPRSQGIGVGYSPEWLSSSQALINSQLNKAQEDRLRDTKGSLSAAGLSGNPRAYEATSGRVQRDTQRELQDAMSKLTIADMERKNQERDTNTARLGQFNQFEFGQGNTAANFDLNKWGQQNQQALASAGMNNQNFWTGLNNQNEVISDLGQSALALTMAPETGGASLMMPSSTTGGYGVSPSAANLASGGYGTSLKQSPEYARLMRLTA